MAEVQIKLTEFSELTTRYTADFVGREWLVEQVQALLDDPGCRFVVLTGGPGVGKTAFLAHLAATHPQWPRYFIRRDSKDLIRPGDANTFLLTIGGQLATLYPSLFYPEILEVVVHQRIGKVKSGGEATAVRIKELHASPFYRVALLAEQEIRQVAGKAVAVEIGRLVSEPRLVQMQDLQYLGLLDPARVLARENPEARIVVLVDALDELRYSPTEPDIVRALRELPDVPSNLRFVISSRPEAFLGQLLVRDDARELVLDVAGVNNHADLYAYAESAVDVDGWGPALEQEGLTPEAFVDRLLGKAAGNFLYLKSVLGGIQQALEDTAGQERLGHLLRVEELPDELGGLYGHFLTFIVKWAEDEFGATALREYLRPFLGVLAVAQEPLNEEQIIAFAGIEREAVRDLQRELRQFVEAVDGEHPVYRIYHASFAEFLLDSERNHDYWIDGQERHRCIASYYLADSSRRSTHEGYAFRHLSVHLAEAGMERELWTLLEQPLWYLGQRSYDPARRTYAIDIERAIRLAVLQGIDGLPDVAAYSLLYASLVTQTTDIPPEAVEVMARLGDLQQALRRVELIGDYETSARALCRLALVEYEKGQISEAQGLLRLGYKAMEVLTLPTLIELAEVAHQIGKTEVAHSILEHAYSHAAGLPESFHRPACLARIADTMWRLDSKERAEQVVHDALVEAEQIADSLMYYRTQAFVEIARTKLAMGYESSAGELLRAAERIASITSGGSRWVAKRDISALMAEMGQVNRALEIARDIHPSDEGNEALSAIAVAIGRNSQAEQAMEVLAEIRDIYYQAWTLCEIAEQHPEMINHQCIIDFWEAAQDSLGENKPQVLAFVARAAWLAGQYDLAQQVLDDVLTDCESMLYRRGEDAMIAGEALAKIGSQLAKCCEFTHAFAIVDLLAGDERNEVLTAIAEAAGLQEDVEKGQAVLDRVLAYTDSVGIWNKAELLTYVAWTKLNLGEETVARELAIQAKFFLERVFDKPRVGVLVAAAWAHLGQLGEAAEILQASFSWHPDVPSRESLLRIAQRLSQAQTLTEASLLIDTKAHYFWDQIISDIREMLKVGDLTQALIRAETLAISDAKVQALGIIFDDVSRSSSSVSFTNTVFVALKLARSRGWNEVNMHISALISPLRIIGGCGSVVDLYERMWATLDLLQTITETGQ
jgi:tetratricopeptide (TPR) repeat protein